MLVAKLIKRTVLFAVFLGLYLASSVPVGLFLYSLKSDIGLNVFSKTGFHSYLHCLREEAHKIEIKEQGGKKQRASAPKKP
ncbi:MAG TPA: hypothetical protein DEA55_05790 [Rhodospirillaceae bacterium]|nr:hypothetical protein [Rhodospirillaceae bacterium]